MRIVIVGAPGTGKTQLANDLHLAFKKDAGLTLPVAGSSNDFMATFGHAVGLLADYRVELSLAIRRAFSMQDNENAIFEGSLLDSVAHAAARYQLCLEADNSDVAYTQWLAMTMCARILRDTWRADHVVYIKPSDAEPFEADIDEALIAMMREVEIEFKEIHQDDLYDDDSYAKIVEELVKEFSEHRPERTDSEADDQDN